MYKQKSLPFVKTLNGISKKTFDIHHDKLYGGYIKKSNTIKERLTEIAKSDNPEGNQIYSELRALKNAESFANNGVYLEETDFDILACDGRSKGKLADEIAEKYGFV